MPPNVIVSPSVDPDSFVPPAVWLCIVNPVPAVNLPFLAAPVTEEVIANVAVEPAVE